MQSASQLLQLCCHNHYILIFFHKAKLLGSAKCRALLAWEGSRRNSRWKKSIFVRQRRPAPAPLGFHDLRSHVKWERQWKSGFFRGMLEWLQRNWEKKLVYPTSQHCHLISQYESLTPMLTYPHFPLNKNSDVEETPLSASSLDLPSAVLPAGKMTLL